MPKENLFDIAIVGYGPAAITAAIYAARKQLRCILIGEVPGGEVVNSGDIENWPGGGETDGIALSEAFVKHLRAHEDMVKIVQASITKVSWEKEGFRLHGKNGHEFRAKTVIYAAGRHPRLLNVPGEKEFKNRGVSYCATCDAPLFSGKAVAVIGGGNTGAEAVIMLQKIATKTYLLHIDKQLTADPILVKNFRDDPKVEIIYNAKTTEIGGEAMVNSLTFEDTAAGEEKKLAVAGIFVAIGALPNTEPVKKLVELDEFGAIVADRYGATNVPGFFAAGDVTNIRDAQIVVAAGQGCSAALSAGDYLSRLP
ncbi:MAG TPA: FAD-dependent oxidoreductase [Candidatus Andersenbacteria bacterium]|nr:FAD-dependent oxidoreductase [Candidatus Andersenbacteria bacterium]